jgi:hypothetical protein
MMEQFSRAVLGLKRKSSRNWTGGKPIFLLNAFL